MHIRKRGNGYRIDLHVNNIRKSLTYYPKATTPAAARKEAEAYAEKMEKRMRSGYSDISWLQLVELWDRNWLQPRVESRSMTVRCREDYLSYLKRLDLPNIDKVTALDLDQIANDLVQTHSPKTVKNFFVPVKGIFAYAYRKGLIEHNPCDRMNPLPSIKQKQIQTWSEADIKNFWSALEMTYYFKGHNKYTSYYYPYKLPLQWQTFFVLAIYSGARRGELVGLDWDCVDFETKSIKIAKAVSVSARGEILKAPKTAAGVRELGLPAVCIDMMRKLKVEQQEAYLAAGKPWSDSNPVFIQADGSRMSVMSPSKKFQKIIKAYNRVADPLPVIRLHDLRHTNASHLVAAGVDIETVARRLGHSRPSFTLDTYGHALPEQDSKAVEALEKLGVNLA